MKFKEGFIILNVIFLMIIFILNVTILAGFTAFILLFMVFIDIIIVYLSKSKQDHTELISERKEPKKEIPEEMKYCSICGKKIKKQATYCEFCGSKQ